MTPLEALKQIGQGRFSPLTLLTGEEPFFIQQVLNRFREKGVDEGTRDFNEDLFQGEEADPNRIVMAARTLPVFSPRRLVIVREADRLKDDRDLLLGYVATPSETTVMLFVAAKPDLRKKLFITLKQKGSVIQCARLSDAALNSWMVQEGKKRGVSLSEETIWHLKERLGNDLFAMQQEIEKLSLYQAEGKTASLEAVRQLAGGGRSHSVFELIRTVGEKDLKGAFALLSSLLTEGEHPLLLLTMLTRQWRLMAAAKEKLERGETESAVGKKLPMPPSLVPAFFKQLRRWRSDEVRRAFDLSLSADSRLKGGRLSGSLVLEMLILDLCRTVGAGPVKAGYSAPFFKARG